jgi:hypothetical protein
MSAKRTFGCVALVICVSVLFAGDTVSPNKTDPPARQALGEYVVLGWNDLGMHCMNQSFASLCVLPPFNNIWCQVIHRGDPPQVVQGGVNLSYRFPDNTYSVGKVDFWTYARELFGITLAPNVGLTGNGLTGTMIWNGTAFEVTGVPLTPYDDASPTAEQPYQLAEITLRSNVTQALLDQTVIVAPVSVEMHCELCHARGGGSVYDNILALHDEESGTNLLASKPVLCADCHASNALGKPGHANVPSLSLAMHETHGEERPDIDCYSCHPGTRTQCLRDIMYQNGKQCTDCHGSIAQVASSIESGRRPWLDEPRCETCHPTHPENAGTLYRFSTGHGGLHCAACHNSPHAILPTIQSRDMFQAVRVQGKATTIKDCSVCHTAPPAGPGPHGLMAPPARAGRWEEYL